MKLEAEKETKSVVEQSKETEEERIERLVNERYKAVLGDKLKQDSGLPSGNGRVFTQAQIDNMSEQEFKENSKEIFRAISEGRIK